jgi:hypothetical protein
MNFNYKISANITTAFKRFSLSYDDDRGIVDDVLLKNLLAGSRRQT